jgi:peptidoglycan/LPS O-acetylase OafA/YrhL
MAFHFGLGWFSGGFLGVDVFYVLSGFLITLLLLHELERRQSVGLGAFWARRARRLLPCLVLVVVAVTFYVADVAPAGSYPGFRMDALSALFYFSNWHQIAASSNYFASTGPVSPLTHTWSLAIEEQFYLVWPLVVLTVMRVCGEFRRALRVLTALSIFGAVASAIEMAMLYSPTADTTRLYFGTDTHAQSILIGAALACVLAGIALRRRSVAAAVRTQHAPIRPAVHSGSAPPEVPLTEGTPALAVPMVSSPLVRRTLSVAGLVGLGAVVALCHVLSGNASATYRGGFALTDVCCAAVIVGATTVPSGLLSRLLGLRPLVWLGTISYGLYLWHFPLALYLSPERTGISGLALFCVRCMATVAVAAASYYLVERPVMDKTFWRSVRALVPSAVTVGGAVALLFAATSGSAALVPSAAHFRSSSSSGARDVAAASSSKSVGAEPVPPSRVVVLGDSTALTLGYALSATAPTGTTVVNGGLFACGLAIATNASGDAPSPGLPMTEACNSASSPQDQWPARDRAEVAGTGHGDVVIFLAGHWETQGILMNGQWTDLLSPAFQDYELGQLRLLVHIATSHGAHLELFTMACMNANFASGGTPGATDSSRRRAIYNGLLDKIASQYPRQVSVVPFGSIICPSGKFTEFVDGVQVRTPDGVHTPSYSPGNIFAGNSTEAVAERFYGWISPRLWPLIEDPASSP